MRRSPCADELAHLRTRPDPKGDELFEHIARLHGFSADAPPKWVSRADFAPDLEEPDTDDRVGHRSPWNDAYDAHILLADRAVERLFEALEAAGATVRRVPMVRAIRPGRDLAHDDTDTSQTEPPRLALAQP